MLLVYEAPRQRNKRNRENTPTCRGPRRSASRAGGAVFVRKRRVDGLVLNQRREAVVGFCQGPPLLDDGPQLFSRSRMRLTCGRGRRAPPVSKTLSRPVDGSRRRDIVGRHLHKVEVQKTDAESAPTSGDQTRAPTVGSRTSLGHEPRDVAS